MDSPVHEVIACLPIIWHECRDNTIRTAPHHKSHSGKSIHRIPDPVIGQGLWGSNPVESISWYEAKNERHGSDEQEQCRNGKRLTCHSASDQDLRLRRECEIVRT